MRVAFFTLGCKVNQYETQILTQQFLADGFEVVDHEEVSDVYVVNSCTVTSSGDKKTRQIIRRLKRQNPHAIVALTGCFPQAFPDVATKLPAADVITGATNRSRLVSFVKTALLTGERIIEVTPHEKTEAFEEMKAQSFSERTRAYIKIQDGCERYCSYCIIPKARGPVRSKPMEEIKDELLTLLQKGYQEVVLVGINLSTYGKEKGLRLIDAVTLACETGMPRVRLGSLEPDLLSDEDIERLSSLKGFCPQFHLSLQSGCDATLKRMNRHYDTALYRHVVEKIRAAFLNPSITTDIMVGFPGETQEEFDASLTFAKEIGFAKVHVFAYSIREGTRAATMPDQIARSVKELRSHQMAAVTDETRTAFLLAQCGTVQEVLFETDLVEGAYTGYTENYTPVAVCSEQDLRGSLARVEITRCNPLRCYGKLV